MNKSDSNNMAVGEMRLRGLAKVAETLSEHDIVGKAFAVMATMERKGFAKGEMVAFLGSVLDAAKTIRQGKEASRLIQEATPEGLIWKPLENLYVRELSMHVRTVNQIGFESCLRRMGRASLAKKTGGKTNLLPMDGY